MIHIKSLVLLRSENLLVKFNINVTDDNKKSYYNRYVSGNGDYETFDLHPQIVFRYTNKDVTFNSQHQFHVTPVTLFNVKRTFIKMYKICINKETFIYYTSNGIEYVKDPNHLITLYLPNDEVVKMHPSVIMDKGKSLPGIKMYINETSNEVSLSVDELESIINILQSVNFIGDSLSLLNARNIDVQSQYIIKRNENRNNVVSKPRSNPFDEPGVVDNTIRPSDTNFKSLFDD